MICLDSDLIIDFLKGKKCQSNSCLFRSAANKRRMYWLMIDGFSELYGDFSFSVTDDVGNLIILEAKNVPGLKDVVRK